MINFVVQKLDHWRLKAEIKEDKGIAENPNYFFASLFSIKNIKAISTGTCSFLVIKMCWKKSWNKSII